MTTMMFWARGLITWGLVGLAGSFGPALLLNALPALDTGFFGTILSVRGEFGYWVFTGEHEKLQRPSWKYRKEDDGGIIGT